MRKIVILDGVGINLKSSICSKLKTLGFHVLESDSWWSSMAPSIFKSNQYLTKIQNKYLEIMAVLSSSDEDATLIVDRGIINHVIWAHLTNDEIVDNWFPVSLHHEIQLIDDNLDYILGLENSFKPVRILLETQSNLILDAALDEAKYDAGDAHTIQRYDTFYDASYYKTIQKEYMKLYDKYTKGQKNKYHYILKDEEGIDIDSMTNKALNQILQWIKD